MKSIVTELNRILRQPYPMYYFQERVIWLFFFVFVFSFFFSYFFEPFVVYRPEHRMNYIWICLIHAAWPALFAGIYFFVLQKLLKSYDQWTVGKEFLHIGILLFLIGVGNFLMRDIIYNNPENWSVRYIWEEIRNTFLVGMLILVIIVPLNYIRLLKKNRASLNELFTPVREIKANTSAFLMIQTQSKADDFTLNPNLFIVARTDGNYTEFFIQQEADIQKLVKRITLSDLEKQLTDYPHIIKTHRAWLVNLNKVNKVSGNAQGYQLEMQALNEKPPVSRSLISNFNSKYKGLLG